MAIKALGQGVEMAAQDVRQCPYLRNRSKEQLQVPSSAPCLLGGIAVAIDDTELVELQCYR